VQQNVRWTNPVMLESTRTNHIQALMDVREAIGCRRIYEERVALNECTRAYGRHISRQKWAYWKQRCLVFQDAPHLPGMSEASYLLLLSLAYLLRGNDSSNRSQVSRIRLAKAAQAAMAQGPPYLGNLPETLTYEGLRGLAEQQALRSYSDRHHRRQGLKPSQAFYSQSEAQLILSRYPNHRHVYQQAI
jgi:hypothetical protein